MTYRSSSPAYGFEPTYLPSKVRVGATFEKGAMCAGVEMSQAEFMIWTKLREIEKKLDALTTSAGGTK